MFAELQKLLSWQGGAVNWDLARQLAVQGLAGDNPDVTAADRAAVAEAVRLADLWLDEATELPSGVQTIESWTRVDWLDRTLPIWQSLCDPVAERVVAAMSSALPSPRSRASSSAGHRARRMGALGRRCCRPAASARS